MLNEERTETITIVDKAAGGGNKYNITAHSHIKFRFCTNYDKLYQWTKIYGKRQLYAVRLSFSHTSTDIMNEEDINVSMNGVATT